MTRSGARREDAGYPPPRHRAPHEVPRLSDQRPRTARHSRDSHPHRAGVSVGGVGRVTPSGSRIAYFHDRPAFVGLKELGDFACDFACDSPCGCLLFRGSSNRRREQTSIPIVRQLDPRPGFQGSLDARTQSSIGQDSLNQSPRYLFGGASRRNRYSDA